MKVLFQVVATVVVVAVAVQQLKPESGKRKRGGSGSGKGKERASKKSKTGAASSSSSSASAAVPENADVAVVDNGDGAYTCSYMFPKGSPAGEYQLGVMIAGKHIQ